MSTSTENTKILKILITGKKGFFGNILFEELYKKHTIITLSRSEDADIVVNLAENTTKLPVVDLLIHNAGYAHTIPKNQSQAAIFHKINVEGTRNLLKSLDSCDELPKTIVYISSVAVYGLDQGENIIESHEPFPTTPYAVSKFHAEKLITDWCTHKTTSAVILRLPLIVGTRPKGNLAALHRSIQQGWFIQIRHSEAKKSAVIGSDVANFIPTLLYKNGTYNLSDGQHPSINEIASAIAVKLNKSIYFKLPLSILLYAARIGDIVKKLSIPSPIHTNRLSKLINHLTFSDQKARDELGWNPTPVTEWLRNNSL